MSEPYVVRTWDGYCAGCGEKLWRRSRWAHRRCAATLCRHRQPFVTKDHLSAWVERRWPRSVTNGDQTTGIPRPETEGGNTR